MNTNTHNANMIDCPDCKAPISRRSAACPYCGCNPAGGLFLRLSGFCVAAAGLLWLAAGVWGGDVRGLIFIVVGGAMYFLGRR